MPTLLAFAFAVVLIGGAPCRAAPHVPRPGLRAFAQDRTVAAAFGIDHRRLGVLLAGVAGASAAVAGMLFALGNALTPATPYEWFGIVFAVVILGGVGNVLGTLLAGVLVGAFSAVVSVVLVPATAPLVLFSRSSWRCCCARRACSPAGARMSDPARARRHRRRGRRCSPSCPFYRETLGLHRLLPRLLTTMLFWVTQATSWNILSGYSGYFSFGQAAYVGVGAYTAAVLTGRHGVNFS